MAGIIKKASVTIKNVAERAQVSPMTVSLALRDSPRISRGTKDSIHRIARKLGYKPSHWAQALRSQKTQMVAILLPNKVQEFFGVMFESIQEYLETHGYQAMLALTGSNSERTGKLIEKCTSAFDAIVFCPVADLHANEYYIGKLSEQHKPFVVFGPFHDYKVDCVANDEIESVANVVRWFTRHGHRKIAFVSGYFFRVDQLRLEGYKKGLAEAGIEVSDELIYISQNYWGEEAGYLGTKALLRKCPDVTAIFANVDITGRGVYRAIQEAGLRIPQDISVFGYADIAEGQQATPAMSSVNQHMADCGRETARLLMRRLQNDESDYPRQVLVPTSLIVRESCRALS